MNALVEFPLLTIFIFVVVVLVLSSMFSPKRPPQVRLPRMTEPAPLARRICYFCKAEHPGYATFCKECGKRL
jgi:hypothetical protein